MQILLLEKNHSLSQFIETALRRETYSCKTLSDLEAFNFFLNSKQSQMPNLVILSQNFISKEISQLVRTIKHHWVDIKIISLVDRPGSKERIRMLELGCHDCMTKPVDINELLLRIKISCQRTQINDSQSLKAHWNIVLDENSKNISINGNKIKLTQKEYLLAENFYFNPEKIFSRTLLLDIAWDSHKETESNVVEATISGLRKKLIDHNANVTIKSRRNLGYWLETCDSTKVLNSNLG